MPKYSYQAINEQGEYISGVLEARSKQLASDLLSSRGFIPSKVTEEEDQSASVQGGLDATLSRVKSTDLILFSKQFGTMFKQGVPIVRAMRVLESQTENKKLKSIIAVINQDIQAGSSLHDAFRKHPKVFSRLYCAMLNAGETSGMLPEVLERLIYIIEHEDKVKRDIKSALAYPAIVTIALVAAFFILLTLVVPRFVGIFLKAGIDLPLPTQVCIQLYNFLSTYWIPLGLGLVITIVVSTTYLRTASGRYYWHTLLVKMPMFGPLFIKAAMSRFASIFAILQASGIPVLQTLTILSATIANEAVGREFNRIGEQLREGKGIAGPLSSGKYFTPMIITMVAIGEESGKLDEMLFAVAEHYDTEVEYAMKKISSAIGPILVVGLAAVVGFFALAIYLPMWDLTQMVR